MKSNIYIGKDEKGKEFFINLEKDKMHTILLVGETGSGKSIFHYSLYMQLMEQNSPEELGFVFLDMTRVDFDNWKSDYLYLPPIVDAEKALNTLELLGNESIQRAKGKSKREKAIFIHIEECDMVYYDPARFQKAWLNIAKHRNVNNMYLVFSTSRPSPDVLTKTILNETDLKVVFTLASKEDSIHVLGKSVAEKFVESGEKMLVYDGKEVHLHPFSEEEIKKIGVFDGKMEGKREK